MFFQLALLGGYIYAHWLIKSLRPRGQIIIHVVFVGISILMLPVALNENQKIMRDIGPIAHLLILLVGSIGLPYFLLSTTSPLLQSWYAISFQKAIPYRLFALSNLASLLGLLAYPFIIEPYLTLSQQSRLWSWSYAFFALSCAITALLGVKRKHLSKNKPAARSSMPDIGANPPTFKDKLVWFLFSMCSSTMLLSTTNHLTQNVASIPFLWILPLGLYLLSFTLCFDRSDWYRRNWYVWIIVVAIGVMTFIAVWAHVYKALVVNTGISAFSFPTEVVILILCTCLFLCCMFCHGELSARKPAPGYLTGFYLMISAGGAAGGVLVSLIVPKVLAGPFEFMFSLFICSLFLFAANFRSKLPVKALCAALIIVTLTSSVYCISSFMGSAKLLARDFYGCMRVNIENKGSENEYISLLHGTTTHGLQFTDPKRRNIPSAYYSEMSGVGMAFKGLSNSPRNIGIIGLGVGTISAYARPGDTFRFYEIDPLVEKIARKEFTYLSDCRGRVDVVIGDGRLMLERDRDQIFDLLVVDAFSSDSIPVHLLTVEAMKMYFNRLKPDGILALHISNRHLDLAPVIELASVELNKKAVMIDNAVDNYDGILDSTWVLLSSGRDLRDIPEIDAVGRELRTLPGLRLWTDNYSNIIKIMK
jgi:hypothetical protein